MCRLERANPSRLAGLLQVGADLMVQSDAAVTKELRPAGIRVTLVVMASSARRGSRTTSARDAERAGPVWEADGYLTRVAGVVGPMDAAWVADSLAYALTRPLATMLAVVHPLNGVIASVRPPPAAGATVPQ